jgi:hypothetical protein
MKIRYLFPRLALFALVFAGCSNVTPAAAAGPELGLQSWTCRNMTFEQVVDFATKHEIKKIEFIAAHISPSAPAAENLRKKAVLDKAGLTAYSFGVNGTSMQTTPDGWYFVGVGLWDGGKTKATTVEATQ